MEQGAGMLSTNRQDESSHEQLTFLDDSTQDEGGYQIYAETRDKSTTIDLGRFLERPVKIATHSWAQSDAQYSFVQYNPWQLFFNTTVIKNKLHNFGFVRGTMCVKAVVNASPFLYGYAGLFYQPLQDLCPNNLVLNPATDNYLVSLSQRPHIDILPHMSAGGELRLPFFWPKNWLELNTAAQIARMGQLTLAKYTTLNSANGATTSSATITLYAWMENVELSATTCSLSVQSKDEYGTGPVSAPAHAVANIAKRLGDVPVIGKFAKATEIGARAIGGIASMFGFTNVPVIEPATTVAPNDVPPLASARVGWNTEKLALDPKTELTIDPTVTGAPGDDQLAISHIVQREAYIQKTSWTTAQAVNTTLMQGGVTPCYQQIQNVASTASSVAYSVLHPTPMSHIAQMFTHWRGDIIFRIRVICSQYHRGRLLFAFDPAGDNVTNLNNTADPSTVAFTQIIDIAESNEVEIRIPWQQATEWGLVIPWATSATSEYVLPLSGSVYPISLDMAQFNGMFTLKVLNTLTAPVDTSTVSILFFVRGAENLEFSNPRDLPKELSTLAIQSLDSPDNGGVVDATISSEGSPNRYHLYFGEPVRSVRTLLHRYCRTLVHRIATSNTNTLVVRGTYKRMPIARGYDANGFFNAQSGLNTANTVKYNYNLNHPIPYTLAAFVGVRGGANWMVNVYPNQPIQMSIHRDPTAQTPALAQATTFNISNQSTQDSDLANTLVGGLGGSCMVRQVARGGLAATLPDCAGTLFESAVIATSNAPSAELDWRYKNFSFEIGMDGTISNVNRITQDYWVGSGVDFQPLFYLNAPQIWMFANPLPQP